MLYKDIIETLRKRTGYTQAELAPLVGLPDQRRYSNRLKKSGNPSIVLTQKMLEVLGYKVVFVPASTKMQEGWFEPSFDAKEVE